MLVFREIEELVREYRGSLATLGDVESESKVDEERLLLLHKLVSYVNSMDWLSHVKTRVKVKAFLGSRYNYQEVAARFGVSVSCMHKCISYAGDRLRQRIGGTLALIRSGHLDAAERELEMVTGAIDPSSLFVRGIMERFEAVKCAEVDLTTTCEREISFLSYFTTRNIDRIIGTLDPRRLSHVLYVLLKTDASYLPERGILSQCIVDGSLDASAATSRLKEEFIYTPSSHL